MAKRKTFYVPAAIFEGDRSAYAVAVYAYLCFCADKSGVCFPGMNTIAQKCGLSRNTVKKAMNELEHCGLVRSETTRQRSRNGRMRQCVNRYFLGAIASHGAGNLPQKMTSPPSPHDGGPPHQVTPPPSRDEGEINNNSKAIMGDVPSVGMIPPTDTTELNAILEPLCLDTYEDRTFAQSVKQAIRTLYDLPVLSVNGARLGTDAIRERLRLLTVDHIDFVEKQIRERSESVTNGERYLFSCILNAPVDCMVKNARDRNAYQSGYL